MCIFLWVAQFFLSFFPTFTMKLLYCLILQRSHKALKNTKIITATAAEANGRNIAEDKYIHGQWALGMDRKSVNTLFHKVFFFSLDLILQSTLKHISVILFVVVSFFLCQTNTRPYTNSMYFLSVRFKVAYVESVRSVKKKMCTVFA